MAPTATDQEPRLTAPQAQLLQHARDLAATSNHGILVSGHRHRTALALENKGLGTVQYQGPSLGWFRPS